MGKDIIMVGMNVDRDGCVGSIVSIGSVDSDGSVSSVGSVDYYVSVGSVGRVGRVGRVGSVWRGREASLSLSRPGSQSARVCCRM